MTDTHTEALVERVARAIYDAIDTQSGDTIGTVIWNSEHLFYDSVEGEEIIDTARRASMPTCRDAARAAIEALPARNDERALKLVEALTDIRNRILCPVGPSPSLDEIGEIASTALASQPSQEQS